PACLPAPTVSVSASPTSRARDREFLARERTNRARRGARDFVRGDRCVLFRTRRLASFRPVRASKRARLGTFLERRTARNTPNPAEAPADAAGGTSLSPFSVRAPGATTSQPRVRADAGGDG